MKSHAIRRPSRRLDTAPQRILSVGLATATCVGLVGVIGVRAAQDSAAASQADTGDTAAIEPTTSAGLTQADLDAYAAQLAAERQRLDDYRSQLVATAAELQAAIDAQAGVRSTGVVRAPKAGAVASAPKAKAKAKAKAQAQAAPQAPSAAAPARPAPAAAAPPAMRPAPQQAPAAQGKTKGS